ncbi:general odorant-binding protein 67-like isoform X1 [Anopheles stephensi]|uniref:general odorant-binding protein 67-like isoform X1 n=1 Tax=Anopheles stephensi TaxID=30069 RepID=UPI0016588CCF|nr:general odorant-binding protein 67-like isoform X1 [Anopheles stephensi]
MSLFLGCVWTAFASLSINCMNGQLILPLPDTVFSRSSEEKVELSCGEMFNLTDPRNCCSIPYLLPSDVLEPCLEQTPLTPNALEGENCRAECIFNRTNILMDGHFQLETAGSQLTKAIGADSLLAAHIRYAINKCYLLYSQEMDTNPFRTCSPKARLMLDCIFAITYRKCPAQYWNKRDECVLLVRTLNECPYFLVHSDSF